MKIILIDPVDELIINSIQIDTKADGQRLDYYWHKERRERGHDIERIIVAGGFCRVMDPEDPITIPLDREHAGQVLDQRTVICRKARGT